MSWQIIRDWSAKVVGMLLPLSEHANNRTTKRKELC
jgi:hypothetical protein